MKSPSALRPYLFPIGLNLLVFIWACFGVDQDRRQLYFRIDEDGLMPLLPVVVFLNGFALLLALCGAKNQWAKVFVVFFLLLFTGCVAVWTHGYHSGVTF